MKKDVATQLERFFNEESLAEISSSCDSRPASAQALSKTFIRPVGEFLSRGGKRMRPRLFFILIQMFNIKPSDYASLGAVLELAHNATLIIDDIEDNSALRRGKPTLHTKFDTPLAVNAGVLLHLAPLSLIEKHESLSKQQKSALRDIYIEELHNIYVGQAMDLHWSGTGADITEEAYMEMCQLKTGSLFRMAARFACVIAKVPKTREGAFRHLAETIGVAFQIVDDVLDLKASIKSFGKAFGNDITEGKISLPVVYASAAIDKNERARLHEILLMHTRENALIREARHIIFASGAVSKAVEKAHMLTDVAWKCLVQEDPRVTRARALKQFAFYAIERST